MSQVLRPIGVIARSLAAVSNIEFKELHLDKDQYLYVTRIHDNPGIINDALAELVIQDRTTVAKSVRKLIEEGLIRKESDKDNKKIRKLYLTDKGEKVYGFLHREEEYSHEHAVQGLTADEQKELERLLQIVQKNVEADYLYVKGGNKREY